MSVLSLIYLISFNLIMNKVYIVFKNAPSNATGNEFVGVFFNRKAAEDYIAGCYYPWEFFIETYQQPQAGMAHEVFA